MNKRQWQVNKRQWQMNKRQWILSSIGALGGVSLLKGKSYGEEKIRWRMTTSWPKNSPGPAQAAQRVVDYINEASGGQLVIDIYAAGELVPAFEVFDSVSSGVVQMGHSAAFFWQGKIPACVWFTTIPFGMTVNEHRVWIRHNNGQQLWNSLYEPFNIMPFMAGNTGSSMGGWYRSPLRSLDDLKGLKIRFPGIMGTALSMLDAVVVSLPPGEILPALMNNTIDAAEFLGPYADLSFGFYKAAPYYAYPGIHEPNGSAELLVNKDAWSTLPKHLQKIVSDATKLADDESILSDFWLNTQAMQKLTQEMKVQLFPLPSDVVQAVAHKIPQILDNISQHDDISKNIHDSYRQTLKQFRQYSESSLLPYLSLRHKFTQG